MVMELKFLKILTNGIREVDRMGRKLMRVPLDFDAPINEIWKGYLITNHPDYENLPVKSCEECRENFDECFESADYCVWYNEKWMKDWYEEPPTGEGYQLWETTTEGSPQTPVFETIDGLAEYCEKNVSTFGDMMATKEEWGRMLEEDNVHTTMGNVTFI